MSNNTIIFRHLHGLLQDAELTSATRSRYVEGWQRARIEQHTQTISHKEIGPTQMIEELKRKADQEQRVHAEIELLINIKINVSLIYLLYEYSVYHFFTTLVI